jgi:hypothetical protein
MIFISLYCKQLDHFYKEGERDGYWVPLFYAQPSETSSERTDTARILSVFCLDQILSQFPLTLLVLPAATLSS